MSVLAYSTLTYSTAIPNARTLDDLYSDAAEADREASVGACSEEEAAHAVAAYNAAAACANAAVNLPTDDAPGRLPVDYLLPGDRVWSAGASVTVGAVTHAPGMVTAELWHVGATSPEVMHAPSGHTVRVDVLVQITDD